MFSKLLRRLSGKTDEITNGESIVVSATIAKMRNTMSSINTKIQAVYQDNSKGKVDEHQMEKLFGKKEYKKTTELLNQFAKANQLNTINTALEGVGSSETYDSKVKTAITEFAKGNRLYLPPQKKIQKKWKKLNELLKKVSTSLAVMKDGKHTGKFANNWTLGYANRKIEMFEDTILEIIEIRNDIDHEFDARFSIILKKTVKKGKILK